MLFPPDHPYSLELTEDNKKGKKQPKHRPGESTPVGLQSEGSSAFGDKISIVD